MTPIQTSLLYRIFTLSWDYQVVIEDNSLKTIQKDEEDTILFSSMTAKPKLVAGALWDKITFQTVNGDSFTASGLRKNDSESSLTELTQLIGNYYAE